MENWDAYLVGKGIRGRRATGSEVAYPCFFDCREPADSVKRKLYVNSATGLFSCKVCGAEGNGPKLMAAFGDDHDPTADTPRRLEVMEAAVEVAANMLTHNDDIIFYLLGSRRGLSPETIETRRLGFVPGQWSLARSLPGHFDHKDLVAAKLIYESGEDTYRDVILIPYLEDGRVVQIRSKALTGRYHTPAGDPVRLYNVDTLKGAIEAVLVEGEFDTMVLADLLVGADDERLRKMAVIGLAGTNALPDDFDNRLAGLKRIFIGTDPDTPGRNAATRLAERLGARGVEITWPQDVIDKAIADGLELKDVDWSTWIARYGATWKDVAPLLRPITRLVSVSEAGVRFRNRPQAGLKTGFQPLDAAISPGLLPGQVMVLLAKTGVGKTNLLCNLAYNMRGDHVLFITLEMTAEEIFPRLTKIYRFHHPWASDDEIADAYRNVLICDANRLSERDFAELVGDYEETVGVRPNIVFVDYLGYYARGRRGGTSYEKTSDAIMQLKSEGKAHGLSVIVPAQVNRGAQEGKPIDADDARDSGVIEETADFLLSFWRSDDALTLESAGFPTGRLHGSHLEEPARHEGQDLPAADGTDVPGARR